jgi:parvulin-like peptidyl-prolyl isomerase
VKTYVRKRDGTIASYFSTEPPYLGEAAFKLKLFETAGPIDYDDSATGKQYALIKCMATRDDKQLTFDDARKSIVDNFRKYYRNRIAQSVTELLRKKYAVTIYGDVLRQNLISSGINPQ